MNSIVNNNMNSNMNSNYSNLGMFKLINLGMFNLLNHHMVIASTIFHSSIGIQLNQISEFKYFYDKNHIFIKTIIFHALLIPTHF